jgi:hypothetical protein
MPRKNVARSESESNWGSSIRACKAGVSTWQGWRALTRMR